MDSHFTSKGGPPKIIENPHRGEQVGQVFGEIKSEDECKIKLEEGKLPWAAINSKGIVIIYSEGFYLIVSRGARASPNGGIYLKVSI